MKGLILVGILEDVIVNAKSAAGVVSKKAGQLVDKSKLKINMADTNGEINKRYQLLGKHVYSACRETLAQDEQSIAIMTAIDALCNQYAALEREFADKQSKIICPQCASQSDSESAYCSKCGAKLKEE